MKLLILLLLFSVFLLAPISAVSQISDNDLTDPTDSTDDSLGGLIPDDGTVGHVANTDVQYKFDERFYQKIHNLMDETPQDGDFGVYDGPDTLLPQDTISITDNQNGTATILVDTTDILPDVYVFWVKVSDENGYELEPYGITIP